MESGNISQNLKPSERTTDLIVPFNIHHLSIMVPNFDSYTPVGALIIHLKRVEWISGTS